jgi:hypothetical protein
MSNRRKSKRSGRKAPSRPPAHVRRTRQQTAPLTWQPDDYRLLALAAGLGVAMARTALDILNRHPDCLRVREVTHGPASLTFAP